MEARTRNSPRSAPPAAPDHFVRFYERDAALVDDVARYLRTGLNSGCAAITIATSSHAAAIEELWRSEGFDPRPARERGQLVVLDAAQTLEEIMEAGAPAAARFDAVVGGLVRDRLQRFGDVVAFGEMVALLWSEGCQEAAVQLEAMWNALAAQHRFALYCAYPMRDCGHAEFSQAFRHVCDAHSHVIPTEGYAQATESDQLRIIAELQQRSASLEREISVRTQIQAQLAARERELADFLDNAIVGLHRVGPDGTILWANPAELQMLGYAADEYIGRSIVDFHADRQLVDRILATLCGGGVLHDQPARLLCKDGSVRHVLINSNGQFKDGKLVSTRCFTRDVTDRWQAQEALRERGAVLHLAMQGARMGYWVVDLADGQVTYSPELWDLVGLSGRVDWTMESFFALAHPDDQAAFRDAVRTAIEGRTRLAWDFRVRRDMGDWRWLEARGEAIYDASGAPLRFYGVCTDVTQRKGEEALLAHLAAVVDSADDSIVSQTLDGIMTSWNSGAERLLGYRAEEMIGRPFTVVVPPELHNEEAGILARVRRGERIEQFQTARIAKDLSTKRVSVSVSPVRDGAGRIVGVSRIARELKPA
jgi:PAS domain S-box-containing protein